MKVLYINKTLSGSMAQLAHFLGRSRGSSSVFMAERWPRDTQLPGCTLVRIPSVSMNERIVAKERTLEHAISNMAIRNMRNAANVKETCLRLGQSGFTPDVIYTTAQDGYAMELRDVFPNARVAVRLDWFHSQVPLLCDRGQSQLSVYERTCNAFQYTMLLESTVGITASLWQKSLFDKGIGDKIRVVDNGVDTRFFAPASMSNNDEVVTFSCHGTNSARGVHVICQSLPQLLTLRPECKVQIVSFASRKSDAGRAQHIRELSALLPSLSESQRQRVTIVPSPPPSAYLSLLQQSTVYVYLTAPAMLSTGLLEAMSCGVVVLASDTAPMHEIINEENGILWKGRDAQSLAFAVAETCAQVKNLQSLKRNARETILKKHDLRRLLPHHAAAVLEA